MQRQLQKAGVRLWHGEELIKLQDQLYAAIEAIGVGLNKNFVVSGMETVPGSNPGEYDIAAGVCFIGGKICYFDAVVDHATWPAYLVKTETEGANKLYQDGISRATELAVKAEIGSAVGSYLTLPDPATNVLPLSLQQAIAPITDSLANNSSSVYASAAAAKVLNDAITALATKYPYQAVQELTTDDAVIRYRKIAADTVQVKVHFPSISPAGPVNICTMPAGYRPIGNNIYLSAGGDGIIKITTAGVLSLDTGTLPGGSGIYYIFSYHIWE